MCGPSRPLDSRRRCETNIIDTAATHRPSIELQHGHRSWCPRIPSLLLAHIGSHRALQCRAKVSCEPDVMACDRIALAAAADKASQQVSKLASLEAKLCWPTTSWYRTEAEKSNYAACFTVQYYDDGSKGSQLELTVFCSGQIFAYFRWMLKLRISSASSTACMRSHSIQIIRSRLWVPKSETTFHRKRAMNLLEATSNLVGH